MCGRYVLSQSLDDYAAAFGVARVHTEGLDPSYNVAPTDQVYAVVHHEGSRLLGTMRWGFLPHWAEQRNSIHINARAETIADKQVFREAFLNRRCLLPADGFYEWEQLSRGKLPHYIYARDAAPLALAGIWSRWRDPTTGERLTTCAIVTTAASPAIARIHARMPVAVPPEMWDRWLDREVRHPTFLSGLLASVTPRVLAWHPVSTLVNSVENNLPECIVPLPHPPPTDESLPGTEG